MAEPAQGPAEAPLPSAVNSEKKNSIAEADLVLKVVNELESPSGSVPVETVICESEKRGIRRDSAMHIIDEHLQVTGNLYEPKQGFVKLVKPMTV
ncbi:Uncharacterised protein [uncultured archaeon]|nr:Uncharacterised protein [uncultured archaeon]